MKLSKFKSLRLVLSGIVIIIIILLAAVISVSSYNSALTSLTALYINEIDNVNNVVKLEVDSFYKQQLDTARELAALQIVKDVVLTGKISKEARELVTAKYNIAGIYEEVFISNAEQNPKIIVSGNGKQDGMRWGGIGFDDNIRANLSGKIHIGKPGKSPDGTTIVTLASVPVMLGTKVIGIVGLPFDLGTFSQNLIKGNL
ncbi:MAG: hypothetical protein JW864_02550 [Spirochaetes bacterium]|nr:hypothetical protein [Spirochaetota bacterium]